MRIQAEPQYTRLVSRKPSMQPEPPGPSRRLDDFQVGDWLAEPALCRVSRQDTTVRLRPQLMDLLVCLAWRAGRVVARDTIFAEVWPGQFVAESGLGRCVAELRQALEDDPRQPRFIETIPKRGYRLIAPVTFLEPPAESIPSVPSGQPQGHGLAPDPGAPGFPVPAASLPSRGRGPRFGRRWYILAVVGAATAGVLAVKLVLRTPALAETDRIVLCFENRTGEAVFDHTLQFALAVQLEQSPFIRVISDERVRDTLRLMGRDPDSALTRPLANEVCRRERASAMIAGSVARVSTRYVLGLEGVSCETGSVLAREQAEAGGKEGVLEALDRMVPRLRRRLGESLASVARHDVPVTRATTASLDALDAATMGDMERRRGRHEAAAAHYQRAVEIDPSFALAYSRLGSELGTLGYVAGADDAISTAFRLRDRTSLPERLEIEARYHQRLGDVAGTLAALEALKQSHPHSSLARFGLAQTLALVGRYDEALVDALEAVRLEPEGNKENVQLARVYQCLNRFDEARKVAESAVEKKIDGFDTHSVLFDCAFARGDSAAMARESSWSASAPGARMLFLVFEAEAAIYAGKLAQARTTLQAAGELAAERGDAENVARLRLTEAMYEALYGNAQEAADLVAATLPDGPSGALAVQAAVPLAVAGKAERALGLLAMAERLPDAPKGFVWDTIRTSALAAAECGRGGHQRALELLKPLIPVEMGVAFEYFPAMVRGWAHLEAGNAVEARAAFQGVLDRHGIDPSSEMLPLARLGLARAHAMAGDVEAARAAYDSLLAIWSGADPGLPVLATARLERRRLGGQRTGSRSR